MRLKARTNFQYEGTAYRAEDVLDVPDQAVCISLNRDLAMTGTSRPYAAADIPTEAPLSPNRCGRAPVAPRPPATRRRRNRK
jgi:hypothetical protein